MGSMDGYVFTTNILGQLCKHVLCQLIIGITEYSLTNFRSGTLNLSKLACYFSYIPARLVVAMQRHQIIMTSRILNSFNIKTDKLLRSLATDKLSCDIHPRKMIKMVRSASSDHIITKGLRLTDQLKEMLSTDQSLRDRS